LDRHVDRINVIVDFRMPNSNMVLPETMPGDDFTTLDVEAVKDDVIRVEFGFVLLLNISQGRYSQCKDQLHPRPHHTRRVDVVAAKPYDQWLEDDPVYVFLMARVGAPRTTIRDRRNGLTTATAQALQSVAT